MLYLAGKDLSHQSPALGSAVNIVDILVDGASGLADLSAKKMLRGDRFTAKLAPWLLSEIDAKRVTYLDGMAARGPSASPPKGSRFEMAAVSPSEQLSTAGAPLAARRYSVDVPLVRRSRGR